MMKVVNVRDVRNKFNEILKMNEEIIVLKRGVPVASIKPFTKKDLVKYYLEMAQEASKSAGLTEEEGLSILKEVREELENEDSY